MGTAKVI